MKKIILTLLVLSLSIIAYSQNENPFAKFGYDVLVATSSKGEFIEFHDQTDIVEIGSVLFNRQTKEIVKVLDKDETTIDISSATAAMSIDPLCEKYYWISPYAYCANNPIKFVDPDGKKIVLAGSTADRQTSLTHLQRLTNDKLSLRSDGTVIIAKMGGENAGKYLASGSELIRDLNKKGDGAKTVTISIGLGGNTESDVNSANAINGIGSDATVNFDPSSNPSISTKDSKTGNVAGKTRPNEIGLGHELIHADRSMKGKAVKYSTTATHTYKDKNGKTVTQTVPQEELETVGLSGNHKYNENKLRKEQGLDERGAY